MSFWWSAAYLRRLEKKLANDADTSLVYGALFLAVARASRAVGLL
jgi:hypothetical protein